MNFKDVKGKLYPTIGLKKPGDHVIVNFGQTPFLFDIDGYMKVRTGPPLLPKTTKAAPSHGHALGSSPLYLQ